MKLDDGQRLICERVINVFETGTIKGKYGAISIYNDGPHRVRQITYGRSQTTEYGNLRQLIDMYANAGGTHSSALAPYVKMIGNVPLVDNEPFKSLLRQAGEDPVMRATQNKFFDIAYFKPAAKWAEGNGFALALSMLVLYDSFIHSGGIRSELRARFPELTPAKGGDEKIWIRQYVGVRDAWLRNHSNPDVRPSAYRTRDLLREIGRDNWDLKLLPIIANGTPVDSSAPPTPVPLPAIPKVEIDAPVPFLGPFDANEVIPAPGPAAPAPVPSEATTLSPGGESKAPREAILRRLAASADISAPLERLIAYRDKYRPTSDPRYWAIVNFDLHSAKPRLFLLDCVAETVSTHLCAHGRGSEGPADDGDAEVFSNQDGSNCTSLGIYHSDGTYIGAHGESLYLDGLEATNSNARRRHIVLHGADYVSPEAIMSTGRIGRSLGCPAVENSEAPRIIGALKGGSLLIHWRSKPYRSIGA